MYKIFYHDQFCVFDEQKIVKSGCKAEIGIDFQAVKELSEKCLLAKESTFLTDAYIKKDLAGQFHSTSGDGASSKTGYNTESLR